MSDALNTLLGLLMLAVIFLAYWSPTIVVLLRKHRTPWPTIIVNLTLGWTGIGWIVALCMSLGRTGNEPIVVQ